MVIDLFIKNLKKQSVYQYNNIQINIDFKVKKVTLFKLYKYEISIIIETELHEIKNICDYLINEFQKESNNKMSIIVNWYIFNKVFNKNHFLDFNIDNNKSYRKMFNIFCLVNSITGEVFFKPDKIENNIMSDRMKYLCNDYNKLNPLNKNDEEYFIKEISHLYDILEIILKDLRFTYARKIE